PSGHSARLEPVGRRRIDLAERQELAARLGLFQRGQNDLGETVSDPQRRRRDHTVPATTGPGVSAGGGGAASGSLECSTRVPASRSCNARLSGRSPAIMKPTVNVAAGAKDATEGGRPGAKRRGPASPAA